MSSWARATPTRRGNSQLVPMSQPETPTRMNATMNRAEWVANLMSEPSTRASPPPAAGPLTAAMMGWGSARIRGMRPAMRFCTAIPRWAPLVATGPGGRP